MSWYVRQLLLNAEEIYSSASGGGIKSVFSVNILDDEADSFDYIQDHYDQNIGVSTPALDSNDEFCDLILVEKEIESLYLRGYITDDDINLLRLLKYNPPFSQLGKTLGVGRFTLTKNFARICNVISSGLGGEFTDEGYAKYMQEKYNLDEEKYTKILDYMQSNIKE